MTFNGISINMNTSVGTCTYGGIFVGFVDSWADTLDFSRSMLSKWAGSSLCPATGAWTADDALVGWNHGISVPHHDLSLAG